MHERARQTESTVGFTVFLTLVLVWCGISAGEVVVFTRDGAQHTEIWTIRQGGHVEMTSSTGQVSSVALDRVLFIATDRCPNPAAGYPKVSLTGGEVLSGELAEDQKPGHLSLVSRSWGRLDVPLAQVGSFSFGPAPSITAPHDDPHVVFRNGDVAFGKIDRIEAGEVTLHTEFGETQVKMATVLAIRTGNTPADIGEQKVPAFRVELHDGQRVHCRRIVPEKDRLRLHRGGAVDEVAASTICMIVSPDARVARLSGMPWTAEGTGYFDDEASVRVDRSVHGLALRLEQCWFDDGFGTRPFSRVTVQIGGEWQYLWGRAGLDPTRRAIGVCDIAVQADGEELTRKRLAGQQEQWLALDVSGVKEITLVTDFGPGGDLGDDVNWCDLVLIGRRQNGKNE